MFIKLRAFNSYDADAVSRETAQTVGDEPSRAQRSFKAECDINEIMRRFGLGAPLPQGVRMPLSGDFTGVTDFQTAVNLVLQAEQEFMTLPAQVRERFANDPAQLIAFLEKPENKDEAVALGLVPKPPERTRDVVQAVDELAAKLVKPQA